MSLFLKILLSTLAVCGAALLLQRCVYIVRKIRMAKAGCRAAMNRWLLETPDADEDWIKPYPLSVDVHAADDNDTKTWPPGAEPRGKA
jgi:hypothetical protein